ncbi:MAG: WD40 repeat domain-containing protein, partial [Planctomycetota bacterium]
RLLAFSADETSLTLFGANSRRADYSIEDLTAVDPPKVSGCIAVAQVARDRSWRLELPSPAKRTSVSVVGVDYSHPLRDFPSVAKYSAELGWVAVGFKDGSVELHSTREDSLVHTHLGPADQWTAVAVSQDGSKFALGAKNGQVQLFDAYTRTRLESGESTEVRNHNYAIEFLNFCNQDQHLVSFDGTSLVVANVADVSSHRSFPASTPVVCSREAAVCCYLTDSGVVLYDARDDSQRVFETSSDSVLLALLPDASRLAILDGSNLRIHNGRTGALEFERQLTENGRFATLCFLARNRLLIGGEPSLLVTIDPYRQTRLDSRPRLSTLVSTHSNRFTLVNGAVHRLDATGKPLALSEQRWPRDAVPLDFDVTPNERYFMSVDGTGEVTVTRPSSGDGLDVP